MRCGEVEEGERGGRPGALAPVVEVVVADGLSLLRNPRTRVSSTGRPPGQAAARLADQEQPDSMAPTLIPKEVLLRILEHASNDGYAIGEPDVYLDDWYEDLCSYSLIARSWTGPAQALLWRTDRKSVV